jgi:hypothetical protein
VGNGDAALGCGILKFWGLRGAANRPRCPWRPLGEEYVGVAALINRECAVRENRAPRQAGVDSKEALLFVCNSDKRHLSSFEIPVGNASGLFKVQLF